MKSKEIEDLLELKNFLLSIKEWMQIIATSPQIREMYFNKETDTFHMETDDRYSFNFKVDTKQEGKQVGKLK